MKGIFLPCIMLLIAALTCGCGADRATEAILDRADSLMESRPDLSLALLDSIEFATIGSEAVKARYALLMSQARDKNYIDIADDSLIAIATDFYADRPDSPELMKSLFYRATAYYNAMRYDKAAAYATHAYEIATKLHDPFWTGKTATLLADIFRDTYNHNECIKFRKIAVDSYRIANNDNFQKWELISLASDYINYTYPDSAYSIINSISPTSEVSSDSIFLFNCFNILFEYYLEKEKFDSAHIYSNKILKYRGQPLSATHYANIGYVDAHIGNLNQAKQHIDMAYKLTNDNNINSKFAADIANWEYLKYTGSKKDILNFTEQIILSQNKIVEKSIKQSALCAQRDFYNHQSELAVERETQMREYATFGSIVAIIIIASLFILFRMKIQLNDKNLELKMNEVAILTSEIENRNKQSTNSNDNLLRKTVDRLLSERFNSINRFFDEYYENGSSNIGKNIIFDRVEKELLNLSSSKNLNEIESLVNGALDNIIVRFREELPDLNRDDVTLFMLNIVGLSPRAIGLLLNIKLKTVYTRKTRLKNKIINSKSPSQEDFLNRLA